MQGHAKDGNLTIQLGVDVQHPQLTGIALSDLIGKKQSFLHDHELFCILDWHLGHIGIK